VAETISFAANEQALRRVASETGGQYLDLQHADLFAGDRPASASRWDPIWAVFAILALAAFIVDVAVRRLRPSTLRALFGRSANLGGDATSLGPLPNCPRRGRPPAAPPPSSCRRKPSRSNASCRK